MEPRIYLGLLVFAIGIAFAIIEANIKKKNKVAETKTAVKAKIVSQRQVLMKRAVMFAVEYADGTKGTEEVFDYQDRFKQLSQVISLDN